MSSHRDVDYHKTKSTHFWIFWIWIYSDSNLNSRRPYLLYCRSNSIDSFCIGSLVSYTLCPHHLYTKFKYFLICLNLNLIQTSTCYNSCCSVSVACDSLCILDHMRHPIDGIHTPFSYWHDIHLEFINAVVKIPYRWIFTRWLFRVHFHWSPSSTSTPLPFKSFSFCC